MEISDAERAEFDRNNARFFAAKALTAGQGRAGRTGDHL